MDRAGRCSKDSERIGYYAEGGLFLAVMNVEPWYEHDLSRSKVFCAFLSDSVWKAS